MDRRATYGGIFMVSLATLMLEILLTRITSVVAWYHLAFFVISLGMLGMTAGAVWVFLHPDRFTEKTAGARMARAALLFALATPAAVAVTLAVPLDPVTDVRSFAMMLGVGAVLALPFCASGVALTVALTRAGLPAGIAYGVDLCGAALGCALVIPTLELLDAPSAVFLAASLAALSAALFAGPSGRRGLALVGVAAALLALGLGNATLDPAPLRPRVVKGQVEDPADLAYVGWNTYSRVTVDVTHTGPPSLWAPSRTLPAELAEPLPQRAIKIDGAAGTMMARLDPDGADPDPSDLARHRYLEWDITSFAHRMRPHGPAAVIGVGGGRDVLEAARVGHDPVVGIEINDLIIDLHREDMAEFSGLASLPTVELVADEARSFLARDDRRFAVITMSLIDTWASTGAGAFSLSENGLYTIQGWQRFLRRLTPDGIFTVSRWYKPDSPGETGRMLALALETLWTFGVPEPRRHVILLQNFNIATLLVSPRPFSDADLDRMQSEAVRLGLTMVATPRKPPINPVLAEILDTTSREDLHRWSERQELDYTAPTDGRPFFFNMLKPGTWLRDPGSVDELDLTFLGNLRATQTLVYATTVSALLTLFTILVPLWSRRRVLDEERAGDLAAAAGYFAAIGVGFMFVEMGLLSRLGVLLGHPTLALAVLLGGIIFFTGVGSLASERLDISRRRVALAYPLVPAALVGVVAAAAPSVSGTLEAAPLAARVAAGIGLVGVPALGMGLGFPLGLRLLGGTTGNNALGPWMWGINGACGVVASGLGLATSMVWGTRTTLLVGLVCYALLPVCTARLHRRLARQPIRTPA